MPIAVGRHFIRAQLGNGEEMEDAKHIPALAT